MKLRFADLAAHILTPLPEIAACLLDEVIQDLVINGTPQARRANGRSIDGQQKAFSIDTYDCVLIDEEDIHRFYFLEWHDDHWVLTEYNPNGAASRWKHHHAWRKAAL